MLACEKHPDRFIGIAVTCRYIPTQKPHASARDTEGFDAWVGNFYHNYSGEPFMELLREGSVVVIDEAEDTDVGSIGSNNITNFSARDTRRVDMVFGISYDDDPRRAKQPRNPRNRPDPRQ